MNEVVFTADNKQFVSCSDDETVKIWNLSPEVFVDFYYADELQKEIEAISLFDPKRDNESRSDYKTRQEKAAKKKKELYKKYYQKYVEEY